jgi:chromosome segregation ATPase
MSTEEKVTQLEQSIAIVTRLLQNHSERLDMHMDWVNQLGASQARHDAWLVEMSTAQAQMSAAHVELRAAQAENERRIAQLVDEHIRTDDKFKELAASQQRTEEVLRQLAESQRRTDAKVFDTDARLDRIAEAVERMTRDGRERPEG